MGSAYTPGLTVSADTVVDRLRRLPIKGEVLVKVGDMVEHDTIVARALLPGPLQTIRLSEKMGIDAKDSAEECRFEVGDHVNVGDVIGETKGLFGKWLKQTVLSEFAGDVESISVITGNVLIREAAIPVDMMAYVKGKVIEVLPEEGAVIQTRGAMVQGIFGIGGERNGVIRIAVADAGEVLDAEHVLDTDAGKILVGGAGITAAALKKVNEVGVLGVVVGAIKDVDLIELLGYDIGVAITGQEDVTTTVVVTEGFGKLSMAGRTFKLLQGLEGHSASLNGATQIRAGVIRPEVISPSDTVGDVAPAHSGNELKVGTPIRVIREPYFGQLATVTGLPAQLQVVESGAEVRVLEAKLDGGDVVCVPRANVEIIATS